VRHSDIGEQEGRVPQELDVVVFTEKVGRWPAGTKGTVVDLVPENGLVEISDDASDALDLIMVPFVKLNVVWSAERERVH
jgi:hypothetical protein